MQECRAVMRWHLPHWSSASLTKDCVEFNICAVLCMDKTETDDEGKTKCEPTVYRDNLVNIFSPHDGVGCRCSPHLGKKSSAVSWQRLFSTIKYGVWTFRWPTPYPFNHAWHNMSALWAGLFLHAHKFLSSVLLQFFFLLPFSSIQTLKGGLTGLAGRSRILPLH